MSSQDEGSSPAGVVPTKKKRGRACDQCRQKKVRCDGQAGKRCANCSTSQQECTYVGAAKKRYPDVAYMENLELQLANMKKLLNKLHPGVDFTPELNGVLDDNSLWRVGPADYARTSISPLTSSPSHTPPTMSMSPAPQFLSATSAVNEQVLDPSDDEELTAHMKMATLKASPMKQLQHMRSGRPRFVGKSSRFMFIQQALGYKQEYVGSRAESEEREGVKGQRKERAPLIPLLSLSRPEYWSGQPWIVSALVPEQPYPPNAFPEPDLMTSLVELYFGSFNYYMPILHRPTFEKDIREGLHFTDEGFGGTVLLVCAIGSRFSSDTAVLLDEELTTVDGEGRKTWASAGYKWFSQVQISKKLITLSPVRVYDLQVACLGALYLHGSANSQISWPLIGYGLRLALDLGAHRKKMYSRTPNVSEELLKRAFWSLLSIERSLSSGLGRPCSIQDEDFDVDLPLECDDEYWIHPDPRLAFKQPPGKPCSVTFFLHLLRLKQIHAFALRTIYSTNKSKVILGYTGSQWEQNIVSEIDSALNQWIDSVPDELRWDPHREDLEALSRSAFLYSAYYALQINVHRPFIPPPRKASTLSFPSLAICTNAARSCIHVMDVQFHRAEGRLTYQNQNALFSAGVVLLLNIWGGKLSGSSTDPVKEMVEVHKAMKMLKAMEPRWFSAGRYWDLLYDLASAGDLPLPHPRPMPNHKRQRGGTAADPGPSMSTTDDIGLRHMAGSRRAQVYQQQHPFIPATLPNAGGSFEPLTDSDFVLPIHSSELGRLPLHVAFDPHSSPLDDTNGDWRSDFDMAPSAFGSSQLCPDLGNNVTDRALNGVYRPMGVQEACSFMTSLGPSLGPQSSSHCNFLNATPMVHAGGNVMASVSTQPHPMQDFIDNDTLAIWSRAPTNFEWDDWGAYITRMNAGEPLYNAGNT